MAARTRDPWEKVEAAEIPTAVEEARAAWDAFQKSWGQVLEALRHADHAHLRWEFARLDAYKVGLGTDEGMGQSMTEFFDEVVEAVAQTTGEEPTDDAD